MEKNKSPLEQVVLVNENDEAVGAMEKMEAHQKALLHRAFSIFIFNGKKEMLVHQRSAAKYHCGGLWTNACCSHPRPGEEVMAAAARRLQEEMGFITGLSKISDFIYKAEFENGLTEYEFDHVLVGYYEGIIRPDPREVQDYRYENMDRLEASLAADPGRYTPWFRIAFPVVANWAREHPDNE